MQQILLGMLTPSSNTMIRVCLSQSRTILNSRTRILELENMTGKLSTHVLDTTQGCPAAGVAIALWRVDLTSGGKTRLKTTRTNQDGRTDAPLLVEDELQVGGYELVFEIGEYFAQRLDNLPNPPFLDRIFIQFGVADPTVHYHVPLQTSPWAYSTYRGS
jgi:5-hydroxyisourate hydrolase